MGKGKKMTFDEIKAGDEVEVTIKTKILEIDHEDASVRLHNTQGGWWIWPSAFEKLTFREVEKPLIPGGANALTFQSKDGDLVFAIKNIDGSWVNTDGDTYESTAALELLIRHSGQPSTVYIYAKVER